MSCWDRFRILIANPAIVDSQLLSELLLLPSQELQSDSPSRFQHSQVWPNDEFPLPFVEGERVIPLLISDGIERKRRPFGGCLPGRPPQFDSFEHIGYLFMIVHVLRALNKAFQTSICISQQCLGRQNFEIVSGGSYLSFFQQRLNGFIGRVRIQVQIILSQNLKRFNSTLRQLYVLIHSPSPYDRRIEFVHRSRPNSVHKIQEPR
ncbi:hypothetical protein RJ639_024027 [Escallonia herrerae]|uniref:Uncharacterized protein n=1 Tax=Escallonia herrerae TaxID=1293975 RepID=A0AA89AF33_9ASTE|nr:hypothetical protein RJ639_024027 [Escallonia herrerae]